MPRDPKAKRMSGVDVCDMAASFICTNRETIYNCIHAYMRYAVEMLQRGAVLVVPGVGRLRVKKMKARNRYNPHARKVTRSPPAKGIKLDASAQLDDIINPKRIPRQRNARGVSDDAINTLHDRTQIDTITINDALDAWGDAAVYVLAYKGSIVVPELGTLRVGDAKGTMRHDVRTQRVNARQPRKVVTLRALPKVKACFR